jgi:aminobenzoyl-glutamate utilization protein A
VTAVALGGGPPAPLGAAAIATAVSDQVDGAREALVRWRRDLHRHAETAWTEFRTSALVARRLGELGFQIALGRDIHREDARMGVPPGETIDAAYRRALDEGAPSELVRAMAGGFTGVVARLRGARPGPTIGFRFDIDALDVTESAEAAHAPAREGFASIHPGAMHACGHDGHTAIGLGLAEVIAARHAEWPGDVVLIFQPGEEGVRGARSMVERGVADDCRAMVCCHLGAQSRRTGHVIGGVSGFLATTKLDAVFTGRESHAGLEPEAGRNALLGAATAVLNLHALPRHGGGASRVNVGVLQAGSGRNVTPGRALLKLETRGATAEVNAWLESRAREVLQAAAAMHGLDLGVEVAGATPSAVSDPALVARVREVAALVPEVRAFDDAEFASASDDACAFMRRVQQRGGLASYVIFGAVLAAGHHTPTFDFDEAALPLGVKVLGLLAWDLAARPPDGRR